jgi:hypothetical protein
MPPAHGSFEGCSNNPPAQRNAPFEKLVLDVPPIVTRETSRTSEISGGLTEIHANTVPVHTTDSVNELGRDEIRIRRQLKISRRFREIGLHTLNCASA